MIEGRKRCTKLFGENYENMHQSIISHKIVPYITGGISIILLSYNIYVNINKLISGVNGGHWCIYWINKSMLIKI